MRMRENLKEIYKVFISDETLLRLLYYKPENANDDPLNTTKDNILDMDDKKKWSIILDRIKSTEKVDDLDDKEQKCRLCVHPGVRRRSFNNQTSSQHVIIDVNVHVDIDNIDFRLAWICDRIEYLMFNNNITGISKMSPAEGVKWNAPNGYVAYRLIFFFGSVN
ncbi:MAG: hypothetical protein ACOCQD_05055 [archaeon]